MTKIKEPIKNDPKTQKDIKPIVHKHSNESYRTSSQIGQTALIQRTILKKQ